MQSRHLRHGYSGRGAPLPTLIGSALADIAIRPHGHRSARPHGLAHGADAHQKALVPARRGRVFLCEGYGCQIMPQAPNSCRVKCRTGRSFQKFLPPEGQVPMTLRKQNSQTGWKNGATLPYGRQAPEDFR